MVSRFSASAMTAGSVCGSDVGELGLLVELLLLLLTVVGVGVGV